MAKEKRVNQRLKKLEAAKENEKLRQSILSAIHEDELIHTVREFRNWITEAKDFAFSDIMDENLRNFLDNQIRSSTNETLQLEIAYGYAILLSLPDFDGKCPINAKDILERAVASTEDQIVENTLNVILMTIGKNQSFIVYSRDIVSILLLRARTSDNLNIKEKILQIFSRLSWKYFQNISDILPFIFECLNNTNNNLITRSAEFLSAFTNSSSEQIDEILTADPTLPNRLTELLLNPVADIVFQTIKIVGNIITGNDLQTQVLINAGVVPNLLWLLDYPNKEVTREACWTISNITAGTQSQIQEVIDAAIIPKLLSLLLSIDMEEIQTDILWTLANILQLGTELQKNYILNEGAIEKIVLRLKLINPKELNQKLFKPLHECLIFAASYACINKESSQSQRIRDIFQNKEFITKLKSIVRKTPFNIDPIVSLK